MKHRNHISRKGPTGRIAIKLTAVISGTPLEIELMLPDEAAQSLKVSSGTLAPSRTTGARLSYMPLSPQAVRCNRLNGRADVNTQQSAHVLRSTMPG